MPHGFPCPNPACDHHFEAKTIKGTSALTCPSCKQVFHFRRKLDSEKPLAIKDPKDGAPPAKNESALSVKSPAKGDAPVIKADEVRVASAIPIVTPAPAGANEQGLSPLAFEAKPLVSLPRRRSSHRSWKPSRILVVLTLVAFLGGGMAAVFYQFRDELNWDFLETAVSQDAKNFNYRFKLPQAWARDPDLESALKTAGLKVRLAMKRSQPPAKLAILARDFEKEQTLPDANLLDEVLRGMTKHFQSFEWQRKEDDSLGNKAAHRIEFQGDEDGYTMKGEVLMATHQGYAYWFLTWAPHAEKEDAEAEWPAVRQGFQFLNRREGYKEKPRKRLALSGTKAPFIIRYPEGLWEKQPLEGYDRAADVALLGTDPAPGDGGVRHDAKRAATFQILALPNEADAQAGMAALEKRLLAKQKEDSFPNSKLEVIDEDVGGVERPFEAGGMTGLVRAARLKNSETRERYVLLAVLFLGDQMLAVIGECDWQRRAFWDQEFQDLLKNLEKKNDKEFGEKAKDN
ncbi:MAG TPA: hypothetical protein VGZ25_04045 [Gemmataceae bacterium]|nr:hypothetical protein [Gemmataceae bacterium]